LPIYGLQVDTADGSARPRDLTELTASYVDRIRAIQPAGPYRLLGWSLGGTIAHAVAGRLQREGERVEFLALLDSHLNDRQDPAAALDATELAILITMAQDLGLSVDPEDDPRSRQRTRLAVANGFGLSEQTLAELPRAVANLIGIVHGSERAVFQGDVVFVRAAGSGGADPSERWEPYVSGTIDRHTVDCGHFEMMKPGPAAEIGSLLSARIGDR
jgi:thioesterase domain-containing protein